MADRILDPVGWLVERVLRYGIEVVFNRYYGSYKGIVIDIVDPEKRNRVRVQVPEIGHDTPGKVPKDLWAEPDMPGLTCASENGQLHGLFYPPEKGDYVWVRYEQGNLSMPVYSGGFLPSNGFKGTENVIQDQNLYKGLKTKKGNLIRVSDVDGDISIKIVKGDGSGGVDETEIVLADDKSVLLRDRDGKVSIKNDEVLVENSSGSKVFVSGSNIEVSNSGGSKVSLSSSSIEVSAPTSLKIKAPSITLESPDVKMGSGGNFKPVLTSDAAMIYNVHSHGAQGASPPVVQMIPGNGVSLNVKST